VAVALELAPPVAWPTGGAGASGVLVAPVVAPCFLIKIQFINILRLEKSQKK
jgi:hypothetical protein